MKATMSVNHRTNTSFVANTSTVPSPRCQVPELRGSTMPCRATGADALRIARTKGLDEHVADSSPRPRMQTGAGVMDPHDSR